MKKSFLLLVYGALIFGLLGGCGSVNSEKEESAVKDTVEVEGEDNTKEDTAEEGNEEDITIAGNTIASAGRKYTTCCVPGSVICIQISIQTRISFSNN